MDIRKLVPIEPRDIQIGTPLRFDVFGADGRLLLARGACVYRAESMERLRSDAYKLPTSSTGVRSNAQPVFLRVGDVADHLVQVEEKLLAGQGVPAFSNKIRSLAQAVVVCCADDPDAALAQSYLDYHHPYSILHHILVGILVCRLATMRGWSDTDRLSLVCAALTHDIGALALRRTLDGLVDLSLEQMADMHLHPASGVQMLNDLGVHDALWLQAVQEHHEYMDGSGYPSGISVQPHSAASLMVVADAYAAMMRPRSYRERVLGPAILTDLRRYAGTRYDPPQIDALESLLGQFHAGSIVRLANGDMAVVTRHRAEQALEPELLLIAADGDLPLDRPYPVDSADPQNAIVEALHPEISLRFRNMVNRSWGG